MPEAKEPRCACRRCPHEPGRDGPATYDPHTRMWLCNPCWFHTDPGPYAGGGKPSRGRP